MRTCLLMCCLGLLLAPAPAHAVLSLTAPSLGDFGTVGLNSTPATATTSVGSWSVNATGTITGWNVTVGATQFKTADGATLPLRSMTYRGPSVAAATGNLAVPPLALLGTVTPVAIDRSVNGGSSVSVLNALTATGSGVWNMTQGAADLSLTVPSGIAAGTYTSTVTFTLSAGPL